MGVKLSEYRIHVRKGAMFTIKGCYRSVWNHPLLVFIASVFLYNARSYPYLLSSIISASPVLIYTAALLGTLLFYGQSNMPETETERKTKCDRVRIKKELSNDAGVERYSDDDKRDKVERESLESSLLVKNLAKIRVGGSESVIDEICEAKRELDEAIRGEGMVEHYAIISKVIDELLESESESEDSDSERENLDSPDASVSGADRAESSLSPEDSDSETTPILDELHPLLDEDGTKPVQASGFASEASIDSGEETEVQESESDHTKPFITWTEEDQRNLMYVGSSEIERNQRLERILRQRKNMSMVPEINLMEFENPESQFNMPPISIARRNPFDLVQDSAPGSAPSIMSQRRNPFDLPYEDSGEGNLDKSQEELRSLRQPFLRRRDNFLAKPSIFAPIRQERQLERSSFSLFQRESSEMNSGQETVSTNSERESLEQLDDEVEHFGLD